MDNPTLLANYRHYNTPHGFHPTGDELLVCVILHPFKMHALAQFVEAQTGATTVDTLVAFGRKGITIKATERHHIPAVVNAILQAAAVEMHDDAPSPPPSDVSSSDGDNVPFEYTGTLVHPELYQLDAPHWTCHRRALEDGRHCYSIPNMSNTVLQLMTKLMVPYTTGQVFSLTQSERNWLAGFEDLRARDNKHLAALFHSNASPHLCDPSLWVTEECRAYVAEVIAADKVDAARAAADAAFTRFRIEQLVASTKIQDAAIDYPTFQA